MNGGVDSWSTPERCLLRGRQAEMMCSRANLTAPRHIACKQALVVHGQGAVPIAEWSGAEMI